MKTITKLADHVYHIISEPGDGTRYNYVAVRDGALWHFTAKEGTIAYPRTVDSYRTYVRYDTLFSQDEEQIGELQQRIVDQAEEEGVNPYTFIECMRTILKLDLAIEQNTFFFFKGKEELPQ